MANKTCNRNIDAFDLQSIAEGIAINTLNSLRVKPRLGKKNIRMNKRWELRVDFCLRKLGKKKAANRLKQY
jgi:hypothetical protein